ncbi:glycerophosphodiester phosphodiesterase family protein [Conexibacter sp. CPCC 206217]|uniref:glycerophosphodiester phosphodiesterase family protein n=1 Tax=Conexibacter sp. CPCC 206217 TaxID=3064574 RepID=UPI00271D366B|nr:glycerophosphodiester phosphodiesterase family protein [Conexibacter sp. CPCC 206217]MDO8213337.1 glycerophosphodiester phosphodiesterase family protein [Conexibacter sp. CPCC 206217]
MSSLLLRAFAGAAVLAAMSPAASLAASPRPSFDLEAHRGGIGLRSENTLASFGNAIRLGVTTLELDIQITEDGVAVVSHDRRVTGAKCVDTAPATPGDPEYPYVGDWVKDLTLAQVETLDCGSRRLADFPTQENVPGVKIPTLRQVFDLVNRYGAPVRLNVETKYEAGTTETQPLELFVQALARETRRAGLLGRVTHQSFAWAALRRMRQVEPRIPIVALMEPYRRLDGSLRANYRTWLDLDPAGYGGDLVRAAASFRPNAISPVHAYQQNGSVSDPDYTPFVTRASVSEAHRLGMDVIPWTVDDPATMGKLIDDGADGMITDYPDRLRAVLRARRYKLPAGTPSPFDVQAHRGGRAYNPENTLAAFGWALDQPDVSTLELDTVVTRDDQLVVAHDLVVNGALCADTAPVRAGDRQFPYVGRPFRELTLAQVRTLDCGKAGGGFPTQQPAPGERVPTLRQVLALVNGSDRDDVRLNVETKLSPLVPFQGTTPEAHAKLVVNELKRAGLTKRATLQSFDWRTLLVARRLDRRLQTVALVWQYGPAECVTLADECSLQALYGDPSVKSPWTGGLDWWRDQDLGKLVRRAGASVVSANWQVHDPDQVAAPNDDWYLRTDPSYFHGPDVAGLHRQGLKAIPYTLDDPATIQRAIDLGVDGVISDDPLTLIAVAKQNGLR